MSSQINLKYDIDIDISTGPGAWALKWKNKTVAWSQLVERLGRTKRTNELIADYLALTNQGKDAEGLTGRERQGRIKDVGGFVGGILNGGLRSKNSIMCRSVICLDIDNSNGATAAEIWDLFCMMYNVAACCYSTHKHTPKAPRLRLVIPLDRCVGTDEYQAIARRIAGNMDIEIFDNTTYQPERLMFWPSTAKDGEFYFKYRDAPILSTDKLLSTYHDWRDSSQWPFAESEIRKRHTDIKKQGDPETKPGIIGAFCRTYDVPTAIDTFLSDVYEPCDKEDRYTYVDGSTSGGLVIYEDGKFAYSNHNTDPAGGQTCNAFDLVRIHKFGAMDLDQKEDTPITKMPSYKAMVQLATGDGEVLLLIGRERLAQARADFGIPDPVRTAQEELTKGRTLLQEFKGALKDYLRSEGQQEHRDRVKNEDPESLDVEIIEPYDDTWLKDLKADSRGQYLSTMDNMIKIFTHDPVFRGKLGLDVFSHRETVLGPLMWRNEDTNIKPKKQLRSPTDLLNATIDTNQFIANADDSAIRWYFEKTYNITGKDKIADAAAIIIQNEAFHPIKDYLNGLVWDGKERIATVFCDFLGAADNEYIRTVAIKTFVAGVARIYQPGIKFDYMPVLIGPQGIKKSSFLKMLSSPWFSDSLATTQGKEAYEALQGVWLVEVAELSAFKYSDVEQIKHFTSKQVDRFRVPFSKRSEDFPRGCFFVATHNKMKFLKDISGNRRFWPVVVGAYKPKYDMMIYLDADLRDQLWAEAITYYKEGETLYMDPKMEKVAQKVQNDHMEGDERSGMVQDFIEMLLPKSWDQMLIHERRQWLAEERDETLQNGTHEKGTIQRKYVCALEIAVELFEYRVNQVNARALDPIHQMLKNCPGWERKEGRIYRFLYGQQYVYVRQQKPTR